MTVALQGDQGKPRPALVVQSDHFADLGSATILPITGTLIEAPLLRVTIGLDGQNGLSKRSQIMVDKPQTPPRSRLGAVIGHLDDPLAPRSAASAPVVEADEAQVPTVSGAEAWMTEFLP